MRFFLITFVAIIFVTINGSAAKERKKKIVSQGSLPLTSIPSPLELLQRAYSSNITRPTYALARRSIHIVILKTPRSGSTFTTGSITKVSKLSGRVVAKVWEPFCSSSCYHNTSVNDEQQQLINIVTKLCRGKYCKPGISCAEVIPEKDPIFITGLNPRFTDRVSWRNIADMVAPGILHLFNLRRTNLLHQAYSAFHHGIACGKWRKVDNFHSSWEKCIRTVLREAEFATSRTIEASVAPNVRTELLLYEDILSDPNLVWDRFALLFGVPHAVLVKEEVGNTNGKVHSTLLCDNADVDCSKFVHTFADYPCLQKQLAANSSVAWTIPMKNGVVNIHGDCHVLPPFQHFRIFENLYGHGYVK
mmetsp:Transcript_16475/g.46462  ORF Transcript_16475/g.46462 Transcript_16475/m.46462 type:complete len:361 (+) Transcript_16475:113-1195(+)